ncbi:hypothetical protein C2845_PM03G22000 [Panicum miliaceum]|uniref:F-box protein At3g26010-like beta-propeller domain-containing protein n=1 Tax=Panicum miliaceum TaxID=4540 RepID=A0A3L6TBE7_PANMI|nr:hypothetical protein C2845_PM03G22000 [Panicum miliaceum]
MPRPNYGHFINLSGESVPVPLLDPSFAFMKEQLDVEAIALLDSCNGLLLFGRGWGSDTHDSRGYIVCNPVTEQWVAVPTSGWTPSPPEEIDAHTFLHFHPSVSSHFCLVQFWCWQGGIVESVEGVRIYSSQTGLWSDTPSKWRHWEQEGGCTQSGYFGAIENPSYGGAFVNGMLHFIFHKFRREEFEIIAVDGEGKRCRVIRWPGKHRFGYAAFIGQSQGRLHCISGLRKQNVEVNDFQLKGLSIWVLEDYDAEEWVLKQM